MESTDLEGRLVLGWHLLLTGLMDLQVDGKYRLGKKIGSSITLILTGLMDLLFDGKYRLEKKIGSGSFGGHLQCSYPLTTDQHLAWNIWPESVLGTL
jgi:hypothetical protein